MATSPLSGGPTGATRFALAIRIAVVAVVALAFVTGARRLDDALGVFDLRADAQAQYSYEQWSHTHPEWSPLGGKVLEDARLWMPVDANYRIVFGPHRAEQQNADFTRHFVVGYLLPRRPTASEAEWVLCYGCDEATLGERFEVLSAAEGGPQFGRVSP